MKIDRDIETIIYYHIQIMPIVRNRELIRLTKSFEPNKIMPLC